MIAVEKFGSKFMGALAYNLKKVNHPDSRKRAEVLATSFSSLSPSMVRKEVELIRELRSALSKYVWHTSLNFSNNERPDRLTNDSLLEIALDYMRSMGYDDNQYLIVRHNDADHPHVHLLVNRIKYDGGLVSDSNNYHKSQATLRRLEKQYDLVSLDQGNVTTEYPDTNGSAERNNHRSNDQRNSRAAEQDNNVAMEKRKVVTQRSLTKKEIEKTIRTGVPSDKSVLQALLNPLVGTRGISLQQFISECERHNICLLFNQASTGRISGITYLINDFKIKGQALGNRFKWAELIKHIDYEQDRDSAAISRANDRTKARYGDNDRQAGTPGTGQQAAETGSDRLYQRHTADPSDNAGEPAAVDSNGKEAYADGAGSERADEPGTSSQRTGSQSDEMDHRGGDYEPDHRNAINLEITGDVDDEAVHGRKRRKRNQGFSR